MKNKELYNQIKLIEKCTTDYWKTKAIISVLHLLLEKLEALEEKQAAFQKEIRQDPLNYD